jgi:transposase InsO family protein
MEKQVAMDELKKHVTEAPVLVSLDFSPSALGIVLNVDASSTIGWGAVLSQMQSDGSVRPSRYESGIWSTSERKYDAVKLECRGLLKALKKFRFWLYGRYFTIETDAKTLVWLLNQPPNDLPNAMMTRWLTYIRLFDFDVKHIPGKRNGAADALSRRQASPADSDSDSIDDYFESQLYATSVSIVEGYTVRIWLHEADYEGDDVVLGHYLETLERPDGMSDQEFQQLRRKARTFFVRDGLLYKRGRKRGVPPRRVLGLKVQRQEAIKALHDEIGHRGVMSTFEHISRRYQWKGMYADVADYVKTCEVCQRRARMKYEEPLHPTWSLAIWVKIGVDVVYMPKSIEGFGFIVFARDDLSGWVEGKAIMEANAKNVAKFLYEDVICRHGCPVKVVLDRGSENLNIAKELLEAYKINRVTTSAYHPQANGLVERGHDAIINSLSKYCSRAPETWVRYLHLVLWADRISVRRSTGYSAFELVYGRDGLLPVDLNLRSWSIVDWEGEVKDRESLLLARMRQLDERNLREAHAAENLENSRRANKAYFDQHKRLRSENQRLHVGDIVLLQTQSAQLYNRSRASKLDDKWRGPYRIREVPEHSTYYRLEELDGTQLVGSFAGNRLKKFFSRADLDRARTERQAVIRVRNDLEDEEEDAERVGDEMNDEGDLII